MIELFTLLKKIGNCPSEQRVLIVPEEYSFDIELNRYIVVTICFPVHASAEIQKDLINKFIKHLINE